MDDSPVIEACLEKRNVQKKPVQGLKLILGYLGIFLILIGAMTLLPLLVLPFYQDNSYAWWYFFLPGSLSIFFGVLQYLFIAKKPQGRLRGAEDVTLLIMVWVIAILVSSFPYLIWGHMGGKNQITFDENGQAIISELAGGPSHMYYYFTQAISESASGFASAGLTTFPAFSMPAGTYTYNAGQFTFTISSPMMEFLPNTQIFLFHRALMSFVGGVGLVLILSSAISSRSGFQLYLLEGHNDKLMPNLLESARHMFSMYCIFIVSGIALYLCCGMSFFDALCYAMAAVSTGGFGTHAGSIFYFSTVLGETRGIFIEIITEILMYLGMVSFLIHYFFYKRKFRKALFTYEVFVFLGVVLIFYPIFVTGLAQEYHSISKGFRYGTFEFMTYISTTGFSSIPDYNFLDNAGSSAYAIFNTTLPLGKPVVYAAMCILPFLGGFGGSTSGGLKLYRVGDIVLNLRWDLEKKIHREEVITTHYVRKYGEKTPVSEGDLKDSLTYLSLYLLCHVILVIILCAFGYPLQQSIFDCTSAFAGLGETCGLYASTSLLHQWGALWALIGAMFLGRLEINVVLIFIQKNILETSHSRNIYGNRK